MKLNKKQLSLVNKQIKKLTKQEGFYKDKLGDITSIKNQEDFEKLPFTEKKDLREAYPLGLQAVSDEEIVRIHSSSGTTGTPVIIPYT
ncbi:MAG: phenylacetate--CoA ligase, partial [Methanobrevibacter sp.]|nr:phenylacetate--CoA ligase [Candidatus Methanoflexus mossambicus]